MHIATSSVGCNRFLALSYQGCVTRPPVGNTAPFVHAHSYSRYREETYNVDGFYSKHYNFAFNFVIINIGTWHPIGVEGITFYLGAVAYVALFITAFVLSPAGHTF